MNDYPIATAPGHSQVQPTDGGTIGPVADDWHAAQVWIDSLLHVSPETRSNYQREVDRAKWYCTSFGVKPIGRWSVADCTDYLEFLRTQAHRHIRQTRNMRSSEAGWTPFRGAMSEKSVGNTLKVLRAMFAFWTDTGYLRLSPMATLKSKRYVNEEPSRTAVPPELIDFVVATMEARELRTPTDRLIQLRNRFVIRLFERTGLRANESVTANMGDIELISDPKTHRGYWSLWVRQGKGGHTGRVVMDDEVMHCLRTYRLAFGLPETPAPGEPNALILSPRTVATEKNGSQSVARSSRARRYFGMWKPVRRRASVWDMVTQEFEQAAARLDQEARPDDAAFLRKASTHWLRHTTATVLAGQDIDLRHVAQQMRHRDIRTTMIYARPEFLDVARALSHRRK